MNIISSISGNPCIEHHDTVLFFCHSNTFSFVARPYWPRRRLGPLRTLINSTSPLLSRTLSTSTRIWRQGSTMKRTLWAWQEGFTPRGRVEGNLSSMIWEGKGLKFKSWQMQGTCTCACRCNMRLGGSSLCLSLFSLSSLSLSLQRNRTELWGNSRYD